MRDDEMRGLVLQRLYDIRHATRAANLTDFKDLGLPANVLGNILEQLAEDGLINWNPMHGYGGTYGLHPVPQTPS